jgi:hypothetical protein
MWGFTHLHLKLRMKLLLNDLEDRKK